MTFAYGGDANTLIGRDHIPEEEARKIEANYRKGFKGVDNYQSRQRKLVMQLGYIDECPEVGFRAYIYDFDKLSATQAKFCKEFWDRYKILKANNTNCNEVDEVRGYKGQNIMIRNEEANSWTKVEAVICGCERKLSKEDEFQALLSRGIV